MAKVFTFSSLKIGKRENESLDPFFGIVADGSDDGKSWW